MVVVLESSPCKAVTGTVIVNESPVQSVNVTVTSCCDAVPSNSVDCDVCERVAVVSGGTVVDSSSADDEAVESAVESAVENAVENCVLEGGSSLDETRPEQNATNCSNFGLMYSWEFLLESSTLSTIQAVQESYAFRNSLPSRQRASVLPVAAAMR